MTTPGFDDIFSDQSTHELNEFYDLYWVVYGSVAEWSKALVLGTSLNEAWVRIPPLPQAFHYHFGCKSGEQWQVSLS